MKIIKGQKYLVRSVDAGVYFGEITEQDGNEVTMKNARNIWYWNGAASLMQMAVDGVSGPRNCKFTKYCKEIVILGVCEIILCEDKAVKSIEGVPEWTA